MKTNVGYSVVREFIVDTESKAAIRQGLQTIKDWMNKDGVPWTPYALPIFFLAVKTNVGYSVFREFIIDTESKAAIQQGLQTIKD